MIRMIEYRSQIPWLKIATTINTLFSILYHTSVALASKVDTTTSEIPKAIVTQHCMFLASKDMAERKLSPNENSV